MCFEHNIMKESGNEEYLSENEMSKLYASTSFGQLPVLTFFHMGSKYQIFGI